MKQPKCTLVFITPQLAVKMLESNTKNRKVKSNAVNRLSQSIIDGKFLITNNAIGFDIDGILTDGQHRLEAIIKANMAVWAFVITDLPVTARLVIDTGAVRTHADALKIEGFGQYMVTINGVTKLKDCTKLLASVTAYMMLHQTNQFNKIQAFGSIITPNEVVDFVRLNEAELKECVIKTLAITGDCPYVQDTHMFFVNQMHTFFNEDRIAKFIRIASGKEIAENPDTCPATKLQKALQENAIKRFGTKYNTKDLLGMVIDASNKFMQNVEMKPKAKLVGRPNDANLINVQFTGDLTDKAVTFFNAIKHPVKLVIA